MKLVIALGLVAAFAGPLAAQDGKGGEVGEGPGTVVVVNQLDRGVNVWINGDIKGAVDAGDEVRFEGVPSGGLSIQAGGVGVGGPVASEESVLQAGETFIWTIYPLVSWGEEKGTGTLVVVNTLEEPVEIRFGTNVAGRLAPGSRRAYARVTAGEVEVLAEGPEGAMVEERTLSVVPGGLVTWRIGELPPASRAKEGEPRPQRPSRRSARS